MTIAFGIVAANGIVITADQQDTLWSTKSVADKVLSLVTSKGVIAVMGAGSAGHLDAMAQHVCGAFLKARAGHEEQAIRDSSSEFYAKHIVPLYPFEKRFPDCDIEAIIGVDTPNTRFISRTSERPCGSAVGILGSAQEFGVAPVFMRLS